MESQLNVWISRELKAKLAAYVKAKRGKQAHLVTMKSVVWAALETFFAREEGR